jgi:hypothetical protein
VGDQNKMIFSRNIKKAIERARLDERKEAEAKIRKKLNELDEDWKDRVKIIEAEYQGKISMLEFEIKQNSNLVVAAKRDSVINREAAARLRVVVTKLVYLSNKKLENDAELNQEFLVLQKDLTDAEIKLIGEKK